MKLMFLKPCMLLMVRFLVLVFQVMFERSKYEHLVVVSRAAEMVVWQRQGELKKDLF